MEGQTIQWKDRLHNGRTDNTMEGQTTQWKDRQFNGRTDNTMEGQTHHKIKLLKIKEICTMRSTQFVAIYIPVISTIVSVL
jgi:hypothetical protein